MKLSVILALVGLACAAALPLDAPVPVTDLEEVVKAKTKFQTLYAAAAAAAEAAPDYDLDGAISTYTGFLSGVDGRLSPYYTNTYPYGAFGRHTSVLAGAPLVAGAHHVVAGTPLVGGAPLVYNAFGLGLNSYEFGNHGLHGFHGLQTPFVKIV